MTTMATSFEEPRMEIGRAAPPLRRALIALGNQVELDPRLRELVNLRASILNGCAYCIDIAHEGRAPGRRERATTSRCGCLARSALLRRQGTRSARTHRRRHAH